MAHARARRLTMEAYSGKQFVGIDLHRRRSVIVRTTEGGEVLETVRIVNDVERLASVMARAGECPEVVLEATYGWYWARCVAGCRLLLQRRKRRVRCRRDGHQTNTGRRAHPQLATPGPRARHLRQVQARLGLTAVPTPRWPRDRCHRCARGRSYHFDRGSA